MTASNQHSRLTAADAIRGLREVQNALRDNGMFATELKVKLAVDVLVEQLEVACEALWQLADATSSGRGRSIALAHCSPPPSRPKGAGMPEPLRTVYFEETGEERLVLRRCGRCRKMWFGDREDAYGPVSVHGVAHMGDDGGRTACGIDATGPKWWWPL